MTRQSTGREDKNLRKQKQTKPRTRTNARKEGFAASRISGKARVEDRSCTEARKNRREGRKRVVWGTTKKPEAKALKLRKRRMRRENAKDWEGFKKSRELQTKRASNKRG